VNIVQFNALRLALSMLEPFFFNPGGPSLFIFCGAFLVECILPAFCRLQDLNQVWKVLGCQRSLPAFPQCCDIPVHSSCGVAFFVYPVTISEATGFCCRSSSASAPQRYEFRHIPLASDMQLGVQARRLSSERGQTALLIVAHNSRLPASRPFQIANW
jgi:hypothetical protein